MDREALRRYPLRGISIEIYDPVRLRAIVDLLASYGYHGCQIFVLAEAAKPMARPIDSCDLQTFAGAAIHAPTFLFAKAVNGPIAGLLDMT